MTDIVQINIETHFAEGDVNAYAIVGNQQVTLVDTGIPGDESLQKIRYGLEKVGLSFQDIDKIILTHMHTDHSGGVEKIQKEADVPVYMHRRAKETVTSGKAEFERIQAYFNRFVEQTGAKGHFTWHGRFHENNWKNVQYVDDGDSILAGGHRFQVIYVPGHSQTDICLWDPLTGEAIVGDHLLENISANAFTEPPGQFEKSRPKPLLQYRKSMNRTKSLPLTTIYPGHGDPYEGHGVLVDSRFSEQDERCEEIKRVLNSGKNTVYDISCTMFPWLAGSGIFLGLSEILGHLDLMIERSEVKTEQHGNVTAYQLV